MGGGNSKFPSLGFSFSLDQGGERCVASLPLGASVSVSVPKGLFSYHRVSPAVMRSMQVPLRALWASIPQVPSSHTVRQSLSPQISARLGAPPPGASCATRGGPCATTGRRGDSAFSSALEALSARFEGATDGLP